MQTYKGKFDIRVTLETMRAKQLFMKKRMQIYMKNCMCVNNTKIASLGMCEFSSLYMSTKAVFMILI